MAADLTAAGKTGVAVNAMYDFWTPARHYQAYHGGLRILSESASARLATPINDQAGRAAARPRSATARASEAGIISSRGPAASGALRDIVDYQLIAMESCLYQAAVRREDLLRSFYTVGKRAGRAQDSVRVRDSRRSSAIPGRTRSCSRRWRSAGGDRASVSSVHRWRQAVRAAAT